MNIDFCVSETANALHIMDIISGYFEEVWSGRDGVCIKAWYKELFPKSKIDVGPLVLRGRLTDKGYSTAYHDARMSMHLGNDRWMGVFLSAKSLDDAIKNAIPEHLFQSFQEPMMHFRGNILQMYFDNEGRLMERKENLQKGLQEHPLDGLVRDVQSFYGSAYHPKNIRVYLLLNKCGRYSFAALHQERIITLAPIFLGEETEENLLIDLAVVGHELVHIIEKHISKKNARKYAALLGKKGIFGKEREILREAIVESLVVYGVLGMKYGFVDRMLDKRVNIPSRNIDTLEYVHGFRKKLGAYLCESTSRVLESGRNIFEGDYLEHAMDTLIALRPD